jgi:hypothetical protein
MHAGRVGIQKRYGVLLSMRLNKSVATARVMGWRNLQSITKPNLWTNTEWISWYTPMFCELMSLHQRKCLTVSGADMKKRSQTLAYFTAEQPVILRNFLRPHQNAHICSFLGGNKRFTVFRILTVGRPLSPSKTENLRDELQKRTEALKWSRPAHIFQMLSFLLYIRHWAWCLFISDTNNVDCHVLQIRTAFIIPRQQDHSSTEIFNQLAKKCLRKTSFH